MMSFSSVKHVTPEASSLTTTQINISCPNGCNKTFPNSSSLRLHNEMVHGLTKITKSIDETIVWYHCPIESCIYHETFGSKGKHFANYKYLKQHYLKVHAVKSHSCNMCGKQYSTMSLLAAHQRSCGLLLLCCCGQKFPVLESLQTHIRRTRHSMHQNTILELKAKKLASGLDRRKSLPIHTNTNSIGVSDCNQVSQTMCGQQPHLLAAIALSELSATTLKRVAYADVGVQVDLDFLKKQNRKTITPSKNKESHSRNKRKCTAETQTRLTRKEKTQKRLFKQTSNISGCQTHQIYTDHKTCNLELEEKDRIANTSYLLMNAIPIIADNVSTSGTQTSPRGRVDVLTSNNLQNITFAIMGHTTETQSTVTSSLITSTDEQESLMESNSDDQLDHYKPSQLLIDEDDEDDFIMMSQKAIQNSRNSIEENYLHSKYSTFNQIRSSSIETQTDHDVLLCTNADTTDDADDIILTNTETQTESDSFFNVMTKPDCQVSCSYESNDTPWCSIETQTCEDFSDIEQYLCSTIHTQTQDKARSELFPELTFTDTQTQTGLDYSPLLVTTHTQTSFM